MEARIMIVDDSKLFSNIIKSIVAAKFNVVGVAHSGEEALSHLMEYRPDLVLLDITMPNMDGRECLEKILMLKPDTVVVMVSGIQMEELKNECVRLGASAFINKDQIKIEENKLESALIKTIDDVLQRRKLQKVG